MSDQHFRDQLDSLHAISVEVAALRDVREIYDRTLTHCLELTRSAMGFVDLISEDAYAMDVVAVKGFQPTDPNFYTRFRFMPVRPSVFGVVITERRSYISNDVEHDPFSKGWPPGHPAVHTFLGVPLQVASEVIGMIGVCNKSAGYDFDDERLLATFANQVAVAIDNARLYEHQRDMLERSVQLQRRLSSAEREQLLALERDRIASGLHDEIEQDLFTIGMQLTSLIEEPADPITGAKLSDIRQLVGRTAAEVRNVIFALGVEGGGHSDLATFVRTLLDAPSAAGLDTDLIVFGTSTPAVRRVQGAVRAVVKEALTNVVKHANATKVLVSIRFAADRLEVIVQDDGNGAPAAVLSGNDGRGAHFGLGNMHRQILALGGSIEVKNGEEGGVIVHISVPLTAAATP